MGPPALRPVREVAPAQRGGLGCRLHRQTVTPLNPQMTVPVLLPLEVKMRRSVRVRRGCRVQRLYRVCMSSTPQPPIAMLPSLEDGKFGRARPPGVACAHAACVAHL